MIKLSLIVAMTSNKVIGLNGDLPWKGVPEMKEDMKLFKQTTINNTVIMGRNTFESIGKPLVNRNNIVVSKTMDYRSDLMVSRTLDAAILSANTYGVDAFFIGGVEIYKSVIDKVDKMYISHVKKDYQGDTFFPEYDASLFEEISRKKFEAFDFVEYQRK